MRYGVDARKSAIDRALRGRALRRCAIGRSIPREAGDAEHVPRGDGVIMSVVGSGSPESALSATDARDGRPVSVVLWRIGWGALLFFTAAFALNHLGVFYIASSTDEQQMFELFGMLHLLALVILLIPYRRREWWAWLAMWIAIVPVALVLVFVPDVLGAVYFGSAAVMAVAQFLTLPDFRRVASSHRAG